MFCWILRDDDAFRERTGTVLHEVHQFLIEKQEDDVACFEPLCNAYRSWFVDVGIERSARLELFKEGEG